MIITIDPGHGGKDPGATGLKHTEKDLNLQIAMELRSRLLRDDHRVYMTRQDDIYLTLSQRAYRANTTGSTLFVSIHCNGGHSKASGIECFTYPGSDSGHRYAQAIQTELCARFPQRLNRGVKEANFAVLRLTKMPAVLVECEFITNPGAEEFLASNQGEIADAILHGIYRVM